MIPKITAGQALGWRLQRHYLEPVTEPTIEAVVERLCGVQAQVASSAEHAVRVRRRTSKPGEVAKALADGRLIKTWAMRGTLHLLAPETGGAFLALAASARPWARPSWQRYFGVTPAAMDHLRDVAAEALEGATLTREALSAAVMKRPGLSHIGEGLASSWGTLLKPLAWQGVLCLGPSEGSKTTFMRPADASKRWAGLPDPDEAAAGAITAYFGAYGPTTIDAFGRWLAGGWFAKRQLRTWFDAMLDRMAEVEVDGERAFVLAQHFDDVLAARSSKQVRLLGGFDQWVLGPGTADVRIIAAKRRAAVSKPSGWIAPVVIVGGVVAGTWSIDGDRALVAWFTESGRPPKRALDAEVGRWSTIVGRELGLVIESA